MIEITLRARLTRAFLLTTLAALLLNATLIIGYEFRRFRSDALEDLRTQEVILAKSIAPSLAFNDPQTATQQLQSLSEKHGVRVAQAFGPNGRPFAHYLASPADAGLLLARNGPFTGAVNTSSGDLELAYDVESNGERVGSLYVRARSDLASRIVGYALIQGLVIVASMGLAVFVFGRFQRRITEPITRVAQVAQEVVDRRDWRLRAPASDTRDINLLVQAFNRMLEELDREVTVRVKAEEGLREADRKKDEFLATLAHEIRNPLAPMTNAISLMRRGDPAPALREKALGILDRQMRHVVRLIDDLLDVSRITTGKLSLNTENVDLSDVLKAALELIEPTARARQLTLTAEVPPRKVVLVGDAARLLQVMSNLLSNACRYTPTGGRISVEVRPGSSHVEVGVVDTGVGIDPAMQQRIFELFEQGDKSLERGNTGLGIGLTLARQLVRLHGGEISVQSEGIGHGSRFVLRLPLPARPIELASVPSAVVLEAPELPAGLTVLVADDNVDFAESLTGALDAAGLSVTQVHDGRAALACARQQAQRVGILDIGMPGLNGYDLARALRADASTAGMFLIAVSGWGQEDDRRRALDAGFDRHFVKPVDPNTLLATLSDVVGSARPLQANP